MTERELTGLRGRDRGQTTQDFAVGISVFLLTVTFTFAFVPTSVTPFGSPVSDAIPEKSDRVAATIVNTYETGDRAQNLSIYELENTLIGTPPDEHELIDASGDVLRDEFGLRSTAQVNVTIQTREGEIVERGGTKLAAGEKYTTDTAAASTTRVVRLDVDGCRVGCLLVVRVW
jgi:hypothetical protein